MSNVGITRVTLKTSVEYGTEPQANFPYSSSRTMRRLAHNTLLFLYIIISYKQTHSHSINYFDSMFFIQEK